MVQEQAKRQAGRVSGISNVAYDLLVTMTNKLEGIAAFEEYKLDANAANDHEVRSLLDRLEKRAREDVEDIRDVLVQRLDRIEHGL